MDRKDNEVSNTNGNANTNGIDELRFPCHQCHKRFRTHRGVLQHLRQCKVKIGLPEEERSTDPRNDVNERILQQTQPEQFYWGNVRGTDAIDQINSMRKLYFGGEICSCFQMVLLKRTFFEK